jgi:hypothetical protein
MMTTAQIKGLAERYERARELVAAGRVAPVYGQDGVYCVLNGEGRLSRGPRGARPARVRISSTAHSGSTSPASISSRSRSTASASRIRTAAAGVAPPAATSAIGAGA